MAVRVGNMADLPDPAPSTSVPSAGTADAAPAGVFGLPVAAGEDARIAQRRDRLLA